MNQTLPGLWQELLRGVAKAAEHLVVDGVEGVVLFAVKTEDAAWQ